MTSGPLSQQITLSQRIFFRCLSAKLDDLLERVHGLVGAHPSCCGRGERLAGVLVGDDVVPAGSALRPTQLPRTSLTLKHGRADCSWIGRIRRPLRPSVTGRRAGRRLGGPFQLRPISTLVLRRDCISAKRGSRAPASRVVKHRRRMWSGSATTRGDTPSFARVTIKSV